MPVQSQRGSDSRFFAEAMQEVSRVFEEPVVIKRWVSEDAGDFASGTGGSPTWRDIPTRAVISRMDAKMVMLSGGQYAIGDLVAQFRYQILGMESEAGDNRSAGSHSDRVVYRNRWYQVVGHAKKEYHAGTYWFEAVLRQLPAQT